MDYKGNCSSGPSTPHLFMRIDLVASIEHGSSCSLLALVLKLDISSVLHSTTSKPGLPSHSRRMMALQVSCTKRSTTTALAVHVVIPLTTADSLCSPLLPIAQCLGFIYSPTWRPDSNPPWSRLTACVVATPAPVSGFPAPHARGGSVTSSFFFAQLIRA